MPLADSSQPARVASALSSAQNVKDCVATSCARFPQVCQSIKYPRAAFMRDSGALPPATRPATARAPYKYSRAQVRAALRQLQPAMAAAGFTFVEADPDAVEPELERYDTYLCDRRGLAASTRLCRRKIIRDLLQLAAGVAGRPAWQEANRLRRFVAERADRWSPASLGTLAGALRSYLRYRGALGDDVVALLPVITSPAR